MGDEERIHRIVLGTLGMFEAHWTALLDRGWCELSGLMSDRGDRWLEKGTIFRGRRQQLPVLFVLWKKELLDYSGGELRMYFISFHGESNGRVMICY